MMEASNGVQLAGEVSNDVQFTMEASDRVQLAEERTDPLTVDFTLQTTMADTHVDASTQMDISMFHVTTTAT